MGKTKLLMDYDRTNGQLTFHDSRSGQRLLIVPDAALFRPAFHGQAADAKTRNVGIRDDRVSISFESPTLKSFHVELKIAGDTIDLSARLVPAQDVVLESLELFPAETMVNMYDLVNFRNRHHTPATWPELPFGGKGFETNTSSEDWQFAPHPTMFVLRKGELNLLFGALDLPISTFGMYLGVKDYRVRHWLLSYGGAGNGLTLKQGETFRPPAFRLLLERNRSVHETIRRYSRSLSAEGFVAADPKKRKKYSWHTEPVYCTWNDQCVKAEVKVAADLQEQAANQDMSATAQLDEGLVRQALAVIKQARLPFKTIIIDDGWAVTRGQWQPHPHRFPNMRRLVDEIHALGMKVVLWWAWPEIKDQAQVDERYLIAGGKRNRHGCRMWDFSNPVTQKEYLAPLFRTFFSSAPGCLDIDGIKTDFMADKVHADMPLHDPRWRGEENYFVKLYALVSKLMRRYKPDAIHHAYAGHPHLAGLFDVNRTADIASSDIQEHINRALMLAATCPGVPIAYDFHNYKENFDLYFASARKGRHPVMVSSILYMRDDTFAPWQPADAAFHSYLRKQLISASQALPHRGG
ncbi:MAG: TIM-barrel domain-containing protein [Phycisphaerae bacterium]